jgi:hypothetical protein
VPTSATILDYLERDAVQPVSPTKPGVVTQA